MKNKPSKILSVAVMGHPSRVAWFPYLAEKLPGAAFTVDYGVKITGNCLNAWRLHDPAAKYHVVIQDDALICDDFMRKAEQFLTAYGKPNRAFSFYFGNRREYMAQAKQDLAKGYTIMTRPVWGVAICLPVPMIAPMMADYVTRGGIPQDDTRISRFIQANKIPVYYPLPALVDHRPGPTSLVGDPGNFRRALYFVDRKSPAGEALREDEAVDGQGNTIRL